MIDATMTDPSAALADAGAQTILRAGSRAALIVVDVQNSFLPGGALAVPDGDQIVPLVNALVARFDVVVVTQDWHPPGHRSFASAHPGRAPFDVVVLDGREQTLWPDHCVQGEHGAALADGLQIAKAQLILRKGYHKEIDSYSAFVEADRTTRTGLAAYLRERAIDTVFVAGLATDFCVAWTALDARAAGFAVAVVEDACRAIDIDGSLAKSWAAMEAAGVRRVRTRDLL